MNSLVCRVDELIEGGDAWGEGWARALGERWGLEGVWGEAQGGGEVEVGRGDGVSLWWVGGLEGVGVKGLLERLTVRVPGECVVVVYGEEGVGGGVAMWRGGLGGREVLHRRWGVGRVLREVVGCVRGRGGGVYERVVLGLGEVLSRRAVGAQFERDLRRCWRLLAGAWRGVEGAGEGEREAMALSVLLRLVFLCFIEQRGWLDGDVCYLRGKVAQVVCAGGGIYTRLWRPLFFGILNCSPEQRREEDRWLGRVPYLNGGLFEEDALERRYGGRWLPDAVWAEVLDGFLCRYVYLNQDDGGEGGAPDGVDPVMLGRAFEALMGEDARQQTGSFYTPPEVVERMVCDAARVWAEGVLGGGGEARRGLERLFSGAPWDAGGLTEEEAKRLDQAMARARVLDPAMGSGAFLLGALEVWVGVRRGLAVRAGWEVGEDDLRRHVATRCLYGVDLLPAAVRVSELRLWLALSVRLEVREGGEIPPLPNLDLNLRVGDALHDPWGRLASGVGAGRGVGDGEGGWVRLKPAYREATGARKRRLLEEIRRGEAARAEALHHEAARALEAQLAGFSRLADSLKLDGSRRGLAADERAVRRRVEEALEALRAQMGSWREAAATPTEPPTEPPPFSFAVHMVEVMSKGGFDLVIGNPPWVGAKHQGATLRREAFAVCAGAVWRKGAVVGGGIPSGGQVDVAAMFIECALTLTKPSGVLHLLIPGRLTVSMSGGALRAHLGRAAHVLSIQDWERPDQPLFKAGVWPVALILRPAEGKAPQHVHMDAAPAPARVLRADLPWDPTDLASPWLIASPARRQVMERMAGPHTPVGMRFRLRRGVVTGLNRAFIANHVLHTDADQALLRFDGHQDAEVERAALRVALRGGDIGPFAIDPHHVMVFTHGADGAPLRALPQGAAAHLSRYVAPLSARTGLSADAPPWSLLRVYPETVGPKVVWRDIGKRLEAAYVPGPLRHPTLGLLDAIPLNTTYYAPVPCEEDGLLLAALLNSAAASQFVAPFCERAQGGYRRYFSASVGLLPWPFDRADPALRAQVIAVSRRLHVASPPEARARLLLQLERLLADVFGCDLRGLHC